MAIMDLFFPSTEPAPAGNDSDAFWDDVYRRKGDDKVSWYEEAPELSLQLIGDAGIGTDAAIVDIGGGASRLVDHLVRRGQRAVTVLDLSAEALSHARARLGEAGSRVGWVVSDVTRWQPDRQYDLWHDRAAFHFLTDPADQAAYARVLAAALQPNGVAIIGTFAPDGPETCSGLPVARHDGTSLAAILGPGFQLEREVRHAHTTPWGSVQQFQYSSFRKR